MPQPGEPTSSTPRGMRPPRRRNFLGWRRNSTISRTSSFASSMPATSSNVMSVDSLASTRWRDLPKLPSMPPPPPMFRIAREMRIHTTIRIRNVQRIGLIRISCHHGGPASCVKSPLVRPSTCSVQCSMARGLNAKVTGSVSSPSPVRFAATTAFSLTTMSSSAPSLVVRLELGPGDAVARVAVALEHDGEHQHQGQQQQPAEGAPVQARRAGVRRAGALATPALAPALAPGAARGRLVVRSIAHALVWWSPPAPCRASADPSPDDRRFPLTTTS